MEDIKILYNIKEMNGIKCSNPECGKINNVQARYCFYCGANLDSKAMDDAYKKTPVGKIEYYAEKGTKLKEIVSFFENPLKTIADKEIIKVVLIIVFLIVGIYFSFNKPSYDKALIVSSDEYTTNYSVDKITLIETNKEIITLDVACFNEVKEAYVSTSNLERVKLESDSSLAIKTTKGIVYNLNITYVDGYSETIKFEFK